MSIETGFIHEVKASILVVLGMHIDLLFIKLLFARLLISQDLLNNLV